nr:TTK protein kinase [Cryptococcus depauperatus CBS 7841]
MPNTDKEEIPDSLWANEDESFEVQTPDFHFDWDVDKKKANQDRQPSSRPLNPLSTCKVPHSLRRTASSTPPLTASSARSSLSSAQVLSMTDTSITSTSPLMPTPPETVSGVDTHSPPLRGNIGSEGNSNGRSGKIYGGQREVQRVVSAPVPPNRDTERAERDNVVVDNTKITPSTSSRDLPASSTRSASAGATVIDRTIPTTFSAARRMGGLSKFGGPARRMVVPQDIGDVQESQQHSVVDTCNPPESGMERASYWSNSEPSANKLSEGLPESDGAPIEDRPFRPFGKLSESNKGLAGKSSSLSSNRYPVSQPLSEPAVLNTAVDRLSPPNQQALERSNNPLYSNQRTVHPTTAIENRQHAALPISTPASVTLNTLPSDQAILSTPVAPQTKSLFHVNGITYERLQRLGKGGSSTVYSVLYPAPKKKVIYALKVVQLDRADSETYQSYTNEIELLKRLRGHDRVIQLMDHQITFNQHNRPHRLLMVMECGEIDFAALLDEQRGKTINMNFVGLYWEQMLEAVQAVHRENVVHTDLKPANFVLVKGRLKIIDFGIAKAIANDTVNIQRDQQIGTVNYMSPEAIQRMNNQKVLKLSYPSDVWSLGCILYQMIYGSPPFQHINGGPLAKMGAIANPNHSIIYPEEAVPKTAVGFGLDGQPIDPKSLSVPVSPAAIDSMKRCLAYRKEHRLTIAELLQHEFLKPRIRTPAMPLGSTPITQYQMERLVNFIRSEYGLPDLPESDHTAEDLFSQLEAQNALSR